MNFSPRKVGASPLPEVIDLLLADIAIRVQLSKTEGGRAFRRDAGMDGPNGQPAAGLR
jgi:hypothetical protein